jgi:hypothetical protein
MLIHPDPMCAGHTPTVFGLWRHPIGSRYYYERLEFQLSHGFFTGSSFVRVPSSPLHLPIWKATALPETVDGRDFM